MEILSNIGQALTVTVLDTLSCSARLLVEHGISTTSKRAIIVSTNPCLPFPGDVAGRVDMGADPLGWSKVDGDAAAGGESLTDSMVQQVRSCARRVVDDELWVVVDSASDLILADGTESACDAVQQLRDVPKVKRVLVVVHRDLHGTGTVAALKYISDATLELRRERYPKGSLMAVVETEVGAAANDTHHGYVDITHRRPHGKVVRTLKRILLATGHNAGLTFEDVEDSKKPKPVEASDPTANLTFKLNLTDEEKLAKNQVTLPYTHSDQKKRSILNKDSSDGPGQIYYEADDGDDFDEEDPDDDLNV